MELMYMSYFSIALECENHLFIFEIKNTIYKIKVEGILSEWI